MTATRPTPVAVRAGEAARLTGLSVREVWRLAADPASGFPRPAKLSHRITVFPYADVVRWVNARLAAARQDQPQ